MSLPPGFLAQSLNRIQPSPTIAITTKARELKAAGNIRQGMGALKFLSFSRFRQYNCWVRADPDLKRREWWEEMRLWA